MFILFPKPRPAFEIDYQFECNQNNLKYVWYFSLLSCIVFGIHLLHHFRLGWEALSAEMMPYTLIYSFAIIYPAFNMILLGKLKDISALTPIAVFIELMFPIFMASIAVLLSIQSGLNGLGVTPFAIIMMVVCFAIQGHVLMIFSVVTIAFLCLSVTLVWFADAAVYSPLVATCFTTSIACIVISSLTEQMRIRQFEALSELSANNRQLKLLSQQDHLTGLLNRRAIDNIMERELSRSERFDHAFSVLIIDIDDFKHINDAYGHLYGDEIITKVADCIKMHVRDIDYVGRIGGDEFIVLLVETDHTSALQIADRMRTEVSKICTDDKNEKITISVGHSLSEGESHIALIEKADKALYAAKTAGKNKVRSLLSASEG